MTMTVDEMAAELNISLPCDLWALGCGLPAGMGLTQGVVRLEPSAVMDLHR